MLLRRVAFALSLVLLLVTAAAAQQVPPIADAYVAPSSGTVNYGTAPNLYVTGSGSSSLVTGGPSVNSLVQFDLSGLPSYVTTASNPASLIQKATLTIYVNRVLGGGMLDVSLANGSWTELTVNANNAPAPGAIVAASVPVTV